MPDHALLSGRKKRLRGSARSENLIYVIHRANGVKLVEIHVIGVKALQGTLQLLACTLRVPMHGLFCKEDLAAIWLQCFPQLAFRLAIEVGRGAVKIVHATVVRLGDAARSHLLGKATDNDATHRDDGKIDSIFIRAAG